MHELRYREAERRLWESKAAAPTERRLKLATLRPVRIQELGDGPPLVFVHGGATAGASWADLAAGLPGYRCILLDRPGCGLSDPYEERITPEAFSRFAETLIVEVLDALGLGSAAVVATSLGANIVLRAASAHPDRISRMVLFGWPFGESAHLPAFMRATSVPVLGSLTAALPVNERVARMIFRSIGHGATVKEGRLSRTDIAWFASLLRDTDTQKNDLALARPLVSPLRGIRDRVVLSDGLLSRVQAPALLLWGDRDPFGTPEVAARFVKRLPDAELEMLPKSGHAPWLDQLTTCIERTTAFLRP